MNEVRTADIHRITSETEIRLHINLDGTGEQSINTGVGFFDHMLAPIARHGLFDLNITANGDTHIDDHHTVEDVGIVLGKAIREALSDKRGIVRYGSATVPMDESLVLCAIDLSGRGGLYFDVVFPENRIGTFATELVEEFFRAVAHNALMTLHIRALCGKNTHHLAEASFKAFARALDAATKLDPRLSDTIPSTKGVL